MGANGTISRQMKNIAGQIRIPRTKRCYGYTQTAEWLGREKNRFKTLDIAFQGFLVDTFSLILDMLEFGGTDILLWMK